MQEHIFTKGNQTIREYSLTIGNIYQIDKPYENELYILVNGRTGVGFKQDGAGIYTLDVDKELRFTCLPKSWKIAEKVNPFYIQGWYINNGYRGYRVVPAVNIKDDSWGGHFVKRDDLLDTIIGMLDRQPNITIYVYGLGRFSKPCRSEKYRFDGAEHGIQYGRKTVIQNTYDL